MSGYRFDGVEVGRLEDPALDLAAVLRRLVDDLLERAERAAGEEVGVDGGEHLGRARAGATDGDVARHVGPRVGHGVGAVARDA